MDGRHQAASFLMHDFLLRGAHFTFMGYQRTADSVSTGILLPDVVGVTPDEQVLTPKMRLNFTIVVKILHALATDNRFSVDGTDSFVEPVRVGRGRSTACAKNGLSNR